MSKDELNRAFWLIILTSWTFAEMDVLTLDAREVERSVNW